VKVSSTELPSRQVSLEIEVEKDRLDRAIDEAYRRLAGRVDVPGFRRGKAPRSMVERMLGHDRIVEEALDRLVPDVVNEAMQQENVEPYTRPRVESIEFDPLRVKAVVGLAPKVELGDYKAGLHITRDEPQVGEKEIDTVIERIRASYAQWAPVERAVQLGDRVGIDLEASLEDREQPLMDSKDAEYIVDPEGAQPAAGFAEQLVGMQAGDEKGFTLTMPDDYREKDVAGKPADFQVNLHWVKERELPEVDDEFAQQVGDYTDVAALRSAVELQLRKSEEDRVRDKVEDEAMSKLVELSSIEFPPQLVDFQTQLMLDQFKTNVERQGLQLNQYLRLVGKEQDAFEQEIREQAETRVRRSLALDAFADAEQIAAERESTEEAAESRSLKALARLVEVATGDSRNGGQKSETEKTADQAETSDTGRETGESAAPAASVGEEERGTA
jgi:trigger factor